MQKMQQPDMLQVKTRQCARMSSLTSNETRNMSHNDTCCYNISNKPVGISTNVSSPNSVAFIASS